MRFSTPSLLGALALALAAPTADAQIAATPFPSWTAALQRAAAGGENARVAFIGDSNFDQPRGFYLPLRYAFEAQDPGSAGRERGGAGVAALTGFQINGLTVCYNGLCGEDGKRVANWQRLDDDRGFADPTLVGTVAGDELAVIGTSGPSRFDRATVYLDRLPGGGTAVVEFADAGGTVLYRDSVDLDGGTDTSLVEVASAGFGYADGNTVTVRVVDPRTAGVHVLGVVTDRQPNNSVQVHKLGYFGFDAEDWSARLAGSAAQDFFTTLDLAVVGLGTNDMRRGDDDAFERYEAGMAEILAYFQAAGVPVLLTAVADMAPSVASYGLERSFDEVTARHALQRLAAEYGAAYCDLGALHGDYDQILADGIYRDGDPLHFRAWSDSDPAPLRHGPFFFNAIAGLPTEDRTAGNTPAPTPDELAPADGCGPMIIRTVDGSGVPAVVTFRAPSPSNQIVAEIRNDVNLGEVRVKAYGEYLGAGRTSPGGLRYGPRQVAITPQYNLPATVALPVAQSEINALDDPDVFLPEHTRWRRAPATTGCGDYLDGGTEEGLGGVRAVGGGHMMEFDVPGFSEFFLAAASASALPVELLDFTGRARGGDVVLAWASAQEVDFAHYEVERSPDGHAWAAVGRVLAAAEPDQGATYRFVDRDAPRGVSYYRLALHDLDGSLDYSPTVAVELVGASSGLRVHPNPTSGPFVVELGAQVEGESVVHISDLSGRSVVRSVATGPSAVIDLSGLTPGVYVVRVDGRATQRRLIVR